MPRISTVLIGCGGRGVKALAACAKKSQKLELLAVCDLDEARLSAAAAELGVPAEKDHRKLLARADVQSAIIATNAKWHVPIALEWVRAGKPVFVEKPLGVSAAQCREMVEAAEGARVAGLVGYQARFSDFVVALKREVAQIEPFQAVFNLQRGPMGPQYFFADHYGGIVDTTTHTIHMALHVMGGAPDAVFASVQRGMTKVVGPPPGDQTIEAFTLVIEYDGGKRSVVVPSSMHAVQMPNFVQVIGRKGSLFSLDRKAIKVIAHQGFEGLGPSAKPINPEQREIACQAEGAQATADMIEHFADLASGAAKEYRGCTLREGMYAVAVTEAMVKSAAEGRRVGMKEIWGA